MPFFMSFSGYLSVEWLLWVLGFSVGRWIFIILVLKYIYYSFYFQTNESNIYYQISGMQDNKNISLTNTVIMIRPFAFKCNPMTIANNFYQSQSQPTEEQLINSAAKSQFDSLVSKLQNEGVSVIVAQDSGASNTPDSVFPNNWVSFHQGKYILYPMFAPNRRLERNIDIFTNLAQKGINCAILRDYSQNQKEGIFLEGTGSMVLDRRNKIAYAAISPRTNQSLFHQFCSQNGFKGCSFRAYQTVNGKREPIYHTNVMMWIGDQVAAVCLDSIDDPAQRQSVSQQIKQGRELIQLSEQQIANFAGNCLMLQGKQGPILAMSTRSQSAYTHEQLYIVSKYAKIVSSPVQAIERYGGGSVRSMLAQYF